MRVLIVYASTDGGVAGCAHDLKQHLDIPSDVFPVNDPVIVISDYDIVIAGGSIHAGSVQRELQKFLKKNKDELLQKKFAYFICCLMPGEKAKTKIVPKALSEELMEHAFASAFPGAAVNYTALGPLKSIIMRLITGQKESFNRKDETILKEFAEKINAQ